MNHKEEFDKLSANDWKRKAAIISSYYQSGHNVWDCKRYFEMSIGYISESIQLIDQFDRIKECLTRQEALLLLRKKNDK